MSQQRIRQQIINLIPFRFLRKKLSFKCGWFPGNTVEPNVAISSIKNLKLGGMVYIGNYGRLICDGGIEIGFNTKIGEGVFMITSNHNYRSKTRIPYDNVGILQSIKIGENVWIGAHACICPGVKIEEGAVVAMGSVVSKSVPRCAIVGGNPAKIIGWRDKEKFAELAEKGMTYPQKNELKREWARVEEFKKFME